MAKWGEGDPRWIVEERPDAKNVNNWHWTEKDATNWSKDKFKELFMGVTVTSEHGECKIVEVSKVEGEASVNNRKGKLIYFYEWNLKLDWKGTITGKTEKIKGKIEIPNLSDENGIDDISITVTCNEDGKGDILKDLMRTAGDKQCRTLIQQYLKSLKEDFIVGMILPKKDEENVEKRVEKSTGNVPSVTCVKSDSTTSDRMKNMGLNDTKTETTTLKLKQSFKCTAEELYNALTLEQLVQAFARGPCLVNAVENGRFELFGGNVTGEFIKLVSPKLIEMKWRFSGWPANHYSHVKLTIHQKEDMTEIRLEQTGVPVQDLDRTQSGWKQYYWESIKRTFGYGATLY